MLSILAQEIRDMKVQLGQLVADIAEKQELAGGLVSIPCRICDGHMSGRHVQGDRFKSQPPC